MTHAHSPAASSWRRPTRRAAVWHALKVVVHRLLRGLRNLHPAAPRRLPVGRQWTAAPVVAEQRSPLWTGDRDDEFILCCGKVQNLRLAARAWHGVEVAPEQVVSFWAQLGRPSARRGFAVGREIIAGCVVPTLAGGLCQLSNALASAAQAAGIRLREHHHHSARVAGVASPFPLDATVAWNYVDLQLVADWPFRVEVELTADELGLRIRSPRPTAIPQAPARNVIIPVQTEQRPAARGCLSCDEQGCFRHRRGPMPTQARRAVLLSERTPEFAQWLAGLGDADWLVPWVRPARRARAWQPPTNAPVTVARWATWRRMLGQRLARGEGGARQAGRLAGAGLLARAYVAALRVEHTELVLAQDLLVPLWRSGALGGRAFDVLLTELPAGTLQQRLDAAAAGQPAAASLRDFRVDADWLADEWAALRAARRRVTAHAEVAVLLQAQGLSCIRLPWHMPALPPRPPRVRDGVPTWVLPASALARKGALEVAAAARQLGARVLVLGSPPADAMPWQGVDWRAVGYASDWLAQADVVVLPAYVEHQPRALLQALAAGVPVVASAACGLGDLPGWHAVPAGDVAALVSVLREILAAPG